jgi:hypothetical protein
MPTRTSGLERAVRGQHDVAARRQRRAAAGRGAVHHRYGGLRQPVERGERIHQRDLTGCRRRLHAAGDQVGVAAKVLAAAAQHDDARCRVRRPLGKLLRQRVEHGLIEGVGALGTIERDRGDAAR